MRRRTQTRRKLDDNQKAASNGSDDGNVPVGSGSMVSMKGMRCAVTGGSGFVGQRLVEMALQCGASLVVSFDISPQPQYSRGNAGEEDGTKTDEDAIADLIRQCEANGRLVYVQGDITKLEDVELMVCGGMGQQLKKPPKPVNEAVDIVFHIAALVGPFHKQEAYEQVNYQGTVNVIEACKIHGVTKIVMSSSPSTRFDPMNLNINGLKEDDLMFPDERNPPRGFTAEYARTKAMGERRCRSENGSKVYNVSSRAQKRRGSSDDNPGTLMTVAVAPHQVYGPRDGLFLPNLLNAAGTGKLRIFGSGNNLISMTHVDNYCHALLLAGKQLFPGSKILGKFYIATDGGSYQFWEIIDDAVQAMGYKSLWSKMHLPVFLLMFIARLLEFITLLTGRKFKLNEFTVKMLIINRYFDISNIQEDMGYIPLIRFQDGWKDTIKWFQKYWLTGQTSFSAQPPQLS